MNDIERKQYKNLRECFNNILIEPILGQKYYNMAMDVYESDKECCRDIEYKYEDLKFELNCYKILCYSMLIMLITLNII
ncbi:hypothetical protein [Haloimpatiens massiliensis]|uniref:hypothetical protein n=1 Tax=Haloimpatiens massiliensis TaxID=1658110 RepID=UPI000C82506A|nr:hypothetical protein [Haloimpatiens massiliensis]